MGQLFSHPATIIVVILLIVLLFGAPKLPGMARSLGQSMRIFKSEVEGMKSDSKKEDDKDDVVTLRLLTTKLSPKSLKTNFQYNNTTRATTSLVARVVQ